MRLIPILVATCNICKNRPVDRRCPSHEVMVFNFSKKDSITRFTLSQNLKNGVWLRRFAVGVLFLWQLQDNFFSLFS